MKLYAVIIALALPGAALAQVGSGPCPGNEPTGCSWNDFSPTVPAGYMLHSCQSSYEWCEAIGDGPSFIVPNPGWVDPPGAPAQVPLAYSAPAQVPLAYSAPAKLAAPEISPANAVAGLTLLLGIGAIVRGRKRAA